MPLYHGVAVCFVFEVFWKKQASRIYNAWNIQILTMLTSFYLQRNLSHIPQLKIVNSLGIGIWQAEMAYKEQKGIILWLRTMIYLFGCWCLTDGHFFPLFESYSRKCFLQEIQLTNLLHIQGEKGTQTVFRFVRVVIVVSQSEFVRNSWCIQRTRTESGSWTKQGMRRKHEHAHKGVDAALYWTMKNVKAGVIVWRSSWG